jgi:hypothetical protein
MKREECVKRTKKMKGKEKNKELLKKNKAKEDEGEEKIIFKKGFMVWEQVKKLSV